MDLHVEGHAGAARGILGRAAVVAPIGCAEGLQLEEPALLWELGVGIRLRGPRMKRASLVLGQGGSAPGHGARRPRNWWDGLAYRCPTDTPLGETASCGRE